MSSDFVDSILFNADIIADEIESDNYVKRFYYLLESMAFLILSFVGRGRHDTKTELGVLATFSLAWAMREDKND